MAATKPGDCNWKPQPTPPPAARSASSKPASSPETDQHAAQKRQPVTPHPARITVRELDEAQHLDRQHRKHARHEIQDQPAEQGEGGGQRQAHAAGRGAHRHRLPGRRGGSQRLDRHIHRQRPHLTGGVPAAVMHQHTGEALQRSGGRQRQPQPIVHALQNLRRRVPQLPLAVREELRRARRHPGRPVQVHPIAETAGAQLYFRQMARQPRAGIGNRPLSGRVRIGPFQQRQVER